MADAMKTLRASCLCGAANHDITLKESDFPLEAHICNCTSCRHTMGNMYLAVVFLEEYYKPADAILERLTPFPFSPSITYHFCTRCGCPMMASIHKNNKTIWAPTTGTLDTIEGDVEWVAHGHIQDTIDGGFADFLQSVKGKPLARWPGHEGQGEQLKKYWTALSRPEPNISADDKLHGYCKCGGIEFWVSRPTNRSTPRGISDGGLSEEDKSVLLQDHRQKDMYLAGHCACNSCRLASGVEITSWAFVPTANITLNQEGTVPWTKNFGTLKQYQSSPGACRYFCEKCGAIAFYDNNSRKSIMDVAIGLIDAPEGAKAESWFGWRANVLVSEEDAIPRAKSFALAVEEGLKEWEERKSGESAKGGSCSDDAL